MIASRGKTRGSRLARWVLIVLLPALAACAPRLQQATGLVTAPALSDAGFTASDGRTLAISKWVPAEGQTDAVLVGLHGFNDYRNAFDIPAEEFVGHNIAVLAFDQRGFGEDPFAGIWAGSDRMVEDAREFAALVRQHYPGVPIFLLGDSMGGAVALLAAAGKESAPFDGVVLVAPAVWGWSQMNLFYRVSLWLSAHLMPAATVTGRGLDITPSDNIEMLRDLSRDPLVIKKTRIDAIYGLVNLMERALDAAPDVHLPVLLLYGATDEIIPAKAIRRLQSRLGGKTDYAGFGRGYHMLLRDCHRDEVIDRIVTFINSIESLSEMTKVIDSMENSVTNPVNQLTK